MRLMIVATLVFSFVSTSVVGKTARDAKFLSIAEAKAAIVDDKAEPYFERLALLEMVTKTGFPIKDDSLVEQQQRCRKFYQLSVREFTAEEKNALNWYIKKIDPVLRKYYPKLAKEPWSFLKVANNIEGGLPHTRGGHIILSEKYCEMFMQGKQRAANPRAVAPGFSLLIHEQFHVFQRCHPGLFDGIYAKLWGFKKMKSIRTVPWLDRYRVMNPDAVECSWVLPVKRNGKQSWLWPLIVFTDGPGPKQMPKSFRLVAVPLKKTGKNFTVQAAGGKPMMANLHETPEFKKLFPRIFGIYHPVEALAETFGHMVVSDHMFPELRGALPKSPAKLKAVLKKLLGRKRRK